MSKYDNKEESGKTLSASDQLRDEIFNMCVRYGDESDISIYQTIGALEVVKANLLDFLDNRHPKP